MFNNSSEEINLFPITLKKYKYKNHKKLKEYILSNLSIFDNQIVHHTGIKTYCQPDDDNNKSNSLFDIKNEIISDFENFCLNSASNYIDNILEQKNSEVICTNSWMNFYIRKDSYQPPHSHINSYICGNYYLNFDPLKHSDMEFANPKGIFNSRNNIPYKLMFENFTKDILCRNNNKDFNPVKCVEGELIIWPSWLVHFVSESSENRRTISMNFMPKQIRWLNYGFKIQKL